MYFDQIQPILFNWGGEAFNNPTTMHKLHFYDGWIPIMKYLSASTEFPWYATCGDLGILKLQMKQV